MEDIICSELRDRKRNTNTKPNRKQNTMKTLKTLKEIAIARKSRKGPADKITQDGAYWLAVEIEIDSGGGGGIGQSGAQVSYLLQVRHYRDGDIRAYITRKTWHQNDGGNNRRTRADDLLDCSTIEELITAMQQHEIESDYCENYKIAVSDYGHKTMITNLPELPESLPAPDEV